MSFSMLYLSVALLLLVVIIQTTTSIEVKSNAFNLEECGAAKKQSRITGGKNANPGQYPWMARLGYRQITGNIKFKCGGSLIHRRYILSAAHCVHGWEKQLEVVRLAEHFTNVTTDCIKQECPGPMQDILIEKLHKHPGYLLDTAKNDIALILMNKEAVYNEFVKPICLPHGELLQKNYISQTMEIAGWGYMDSSSEQEPNQLLFVTLPVRDHCACEKLMAGVTLDESQLCVGLETGEDSCTGDSGGPMMRMEYALGKKRYHVIGVVSVGKSYCGEAPAVYTNVVKYLDWIFKLIGEDEQQRKAALANLTVEGLNSKMLIPVNVNKTE